MSPHFLGGNREIGLVIKRRVFQSLFSLAAKRRIARGDGADGSPGDDGDIGDRIMMEM